MSRNKSNKENTNAAKNFHLRHIKPMTVNQTLAFRFFEDGYNLLLHGFPGTGKSFISCYLALRELKFGNDLMSSYSDYEKLVIIRSVVPSRDMGFLPGTAKEKSKIFEEPYEDIINDLYEKGDAYSILTRTKRLEFTTTSFLRGKTLDNAIIIFDEAQNCQMNEIHTVLTRVGDNARVIVSGDITQNDLEFRRNEVSGMYDAMKILKAMDSVKSVEFDKDDVVRSGFVREYLEVKDEMKK